MNLLLSLLVTTLAGRHEEFMVAESIEVSRAGNLYASLVDIMSELTCEISELEQEADILDCLLKDDDETESMCSNVYKSTLYLFE